MGFSLVWLGLDRIGSDWFESLGIIRYILFFLELISVSFNVDAIYSFCIVLRKYSLYLSCEHPSLST